MNNLGIPTARKEGLVIQELSDEVLVYDLNSNKAHCLNKTAAFVWRACNGKNSIKEIISDFEKQTGGKVSEDFIWLAIDQLNEKNLIEEDMPRKFEGQNRRQVLKKIGLASVIALPIVASLTAPSAALAELSRIVSAVLTERPVTLIWIRLSECVSAEPVPAINFNPNFNELKKPVG